MARPWFAHGRPTFDGHAWIDAAPWRRQLGVAGLPWPTPRNWQGTLGYPHGARQPSQRRPPASGPRRGSPCCPDPRGDDGRAVRAVVRSGRARLVGVDDSRDPQPAALPPDPSSRPSPGGQADHGRHRRSLRPSPTAGWPRRPTARNGNRAPGPRRAALCSDSGRALGMDLAQPGRTGLTAPGRTS